MMGDSENGRIKGADLASDTIKIDRLAPEVLGTLEPKAAGPWQSRKAILAAGALLLPFIAATVALFIVRGDPPAQVMTAAEWIGFMEVVIPMVLGIYAGTNVVQKIGTKPKKLKGPGG